MMSGRVRLLAPAVLTLMTAGVQLSAGGDSNNVIRGRFPQPHPGNYDVFVSYCPKDQRYWKEIDTYLVNIRREKVRIYSHNTLRAGAKIDEEVRSALTSSVVAVLLLSQAYIASELMERELPDLLDRVEQGTLILTLHVGKFDTYNLGRITQYQRVGAERRPLNRLEPPDREEVYIELVSEIRNSLIKCGRHHG
jgi:hypothetical protein